MSQEFQAPRGTLDWYGARAALRRAVLDAARDVFEAAGYGQVVTPTFEDTGVFARTSGEGSDVVRKEMYSFTDRSGRPLTLRPEGTAGVMRAYLEHMTRLPQPVKVWYEVPMFRYAAVQKGRYREHYQFGAEAIGSDDPAVDAELIGLQRRWYEGVGVKGLRLLVNSIGDGKCRPAYLELLVSVPGRARGRAVRRVPRAARRESAARRSTARRRAAARSWRRRPRSPTTCATSARPTSPTSAPTSTHAVSPTPSIRASCAGSTTTRAPRGSGSGPSSARSPRSREAGATTAWPSSSAGRPTPGVGFGAGVERLVLTLEETGAGRALGRSLDALFAVLADAARPRVHALMDDVRAAGVRCDAAYGGRRLKRALELADRRGIPTVVIVGDDEWAAGEATVRDMTTGDQRRVALDRLAEELRR